jgi:hypothetical protein
MRSWTSPTRSLKVVPPGVVLALALGLASQLAWHAARPARLALADDLPTAPSLSGMRILSFGDDQLTSKLIMLWLQAFDYQPGTSLPFKALDYARVADWLELAMRLDPRSQYPLLAASRLYGEVADPSKARHMLEFVYAHFMEAPNQRWPWLAHAAIIAKHRLGDLALALKYARAISVHATGPEVPYWARDMSLFILEEMGELAAAKALIGGLIESGLVTDGNEIRFLARKLDELELKDDEISSQR